MKAIFYSELGCPECGKVMELVRIKNVWYVACKTKDCKIGKSVFEIPCIELKEVIRS